MSDAAAFTDAFRRWHGPIRGWLYTATEDIDIANDLASEVFLRAWRHWAGFTAAHDNALKMWLFRIARHALTDWIRSHNRWERLLEGYRPPDLSHRWEAVDTLLDVERGGNRLTDEQRAALGLAAMGYSGTESAGQLGKTRLAVNGLVFRGREVLTRYTR